MGFVTEPVGTHSSRTIMVKEVQRLFLVSDPRATYDEQRRLVVEDNVLQKAGMAGRTEAFRRLRELYALDRRVPLYAALRFWWGQAEAEQPLLAMLCAAARDPLLRVSAEAVLPIAPGERVTKAMVEDALQAAYPNRYSAEVLAGMIRRLLSSWTQSGHLRGRTVKVRARAAAGPAAAAYALYLGYLQGERGGGLFETLWTRLLDAPADEVRGLVQAAARAGWLEYKAAGGVVEVTFEALAREGMGA